MESSDGFEANQEKKGSGPAKKLLILILAFVAFVVGVWFYYDRDATDSVKEQLTHFQKNQWNEAYDLMGDKYRSSHNIEQFKAFITSNVSNFPAGTIAFYQKKNLDDGAISLQGRFDLSNQGEIPVNYTVEKENGAWKIESISFPPLALNETKNAISDASSEIEKSKDSATPNKDLPINTVEKQLEALRNNKVSAAYYNIVSKEFQSETSLSEFEQFIQDYSILTKNNNPTVTLESQENNQAVVKAILDPDKTSTTVEYKLTKENNGWRIWSMRLIFPADKAKSFPVFEEMALPVLQQLEWIAKGEVARAYRDFSSVPFKHTTSLDEFTAFLSKFSAFGRNSKIEIKDRTLQNGMGKLRIALYGLGGVTQLEYTVGQEDGVWKVWGMQVVSSPQISTLLSGAARPNASKSSSYRSFSSEELLKVIEGQLDAIKSNDIAKAYYSYTSAQFQTSTSLKEFEKFVKDTPILSQQASQNFSKLIFNNNIASFSGTLTDANGTQYPLEYDLVEEENKWKILQILVFPLLEDEHKDVGKKNIDENNSSE